MADLNENEHKYLKQGLNLMDERNIIGKIALLVPHFCSNFTFGPPII